MRDALRMAFAFAVFSVMLLSHAAAQLPAPQVTFIPDKISAESSFVMVADPGDVDGPLRINWVGDGYGHFPYIDGVYMCYFSDTDMASTCGPSPFRTAGNFTLDVLVYDSEGNTGNTTIYKEIGGLKVNSNVNYPSSDSAIVVACTEGKLADSISYKILNTDFTPKTSGYVPMTLIPENSCFNTSISISSGPVYVAMKAEAGDGDFGGGIIRVGGGSGSGYSGLLNADPVSLDVLVEEGTQPSLPSNKRIINTQNQTFEDVSVEVPGDAGDYVRITIPNSTIGPYQTVYYTIRLSGVTGSMEILTDARIMAGSSQVGSIPINMKVSYVGGGGTASVDCTQASDGDLCLGGICCGDVCRQGADCCSVSDCGLGEVCSTSTYRCVSSGSTDTPCSSGTCMTGITTCPGGAQDTGTCTLNSQVGICCPSSSTDECTTDSECPGGLCCSGECVTGAECCASVDCIDPNELCNMETHTCEAIGGGGDFDFTLIIILVVIAAGGGVAAWLLLKKFRKKGSPEEEFEKDKDKDVFDEEEFY